ncbi:MAG: hypothetical protein ACLTBV_16705 [Enterocloster bolteae]
MWRELTNDTEYSSEFPVLTGDGSALVFGRVDKEGGMSIWSVGTNGSGLQKLADLEENISTDETNEHYPAGYRGFLRPWKLVPRSCQFMRSSKTGLR